MDESSSSKRGMNIFEAVAGCLIGLGGAIWLVRLALTERPVSGELWEYQWWVYVVYFFLIATGMFYGLVSLFSISIRFRGIPKEDRRWHEENAEEQIGAAIGLVIAIAGPLAWSLWDSPALVSRRFGIEKEKVVITPRPHDCEFMSAPLGLKNCSYKVNYRLGSDGMVYQEWARQTE